MIRHSKVAIIIFLCVVLAVTTISGIDTGKITPSLQQMIIVAGVNQTQIAWIYLKDKGPDLQQQIRRVFLTPHCFQRRMRRTAGTDLIDRYDVPVYQPYAEIIRGCVDKVRHLSRWLNAISVEASGRQLKTITQFSFVEKIDRVRRFRRPQWPAGSTTCQPPPAGRAPSRHTLDYGHSYTQVSQIMIPQLHDLGYTGKGVMICMLDSGFNYLEHEALQSLDIADMWDFVNNDANVDDESDDMGEGGHGSKTLSVIGGYKPGELIGPAYNATFILGKTENTEWERHIEEDHWVAGAEWAESKGADIISSSLSYRDQFTHGETDYTWDQMDGETTIVTQGANIAADKGVLIFNSAGNAGASVPPENTIGGPSDSPKVVAVGAVNGLGSRTSFSSTGPTADGRIKPDVMAMGEDVYAASTTRSDRYTYVNGTSFSCPLTAGAAALILEANPTWSNLDVIQALQQTSSRASTPNNQMGYGLVNAFRASNYKVSRFLPPSQFKLKRLENNFIFFYEYIDQLTWAVNPENTVTVKSYRIYHKSASASADNYSLLVELDASVFSYMHRGLTADQSIQYKIVSVNTEGEESLPGFVEQ